MRIGYLVPEWPSQTHAFFWREIRGLRSLGHDVVLLSTRKPPPDACRHRFADQARRETHYLFPPRPTTLTRARVGGLVRALSYLARLNESGASRKARVAALLPSALELVRVVQEQSVDHVHVQSCADAAHLVVLAHRLGGVPFSLALHGELEVYGTDHGSKMRDAALIVPVTEPLREKVLALPGLRGANVAVVPMGVDVDLFHPTREVRDEAPFTLVTVARLNPLKGHLFVLEATRRLRDAGVDVRYVIAGEGPHRDVIETEIRRLGLEASVELTGTLGELAVASLLQRCDVFVLASELEAAPVSIMEAMACGLPVVCSRLGGIPDTVRDGVDGFLVDAGDIDALTDALARLASDPDEAARMGVSGRERAVSVLDYRVLARRLGRALELASGAVGSAPPRFG